MYLRDDVFHSSSFKNVSFIRVSGLTLDLCFYPHLFILSAIAKSCVPENGYVFQNC